MSEWDMDRLGETGQKVGLIVAIINVALELADLSVADLDELRRYTSHVASIGPILDPTGYRNLPYRAESQVKKRVDVLLAAMRLEEHTPEGDFGRGFLKLHMEQFFQRWRRAASHK